MSRAWIFQDYRQEQKHGAKAPWSVGWYDANGKKRSKRIGTKSLAEKARRKIEGQLAAGVYQDDSRKSWKDFRGQYEETIADGMERQTVRAALHSGIQYTRRG